MSGMIEDICMQPVESDGIEFRSDSVHGAIIRENAGYSGVRVTFVAMIQNARLPMQIDIGFGDVTYLIATIVVCLTMLDFETPRLKGYPKETVIAENFEAMVKLEQLNSCMKDFYDIHVLLRQCDYCVNVNLMVRFPALRLRGHLRIEVRRSTQIRLFSRLLSLRTRLSKLSGLHFFASQS
jgi:hypothetical protein